MRNVNELNVDVTRHAIRAEERNRANGRLHRIVDTPLPVQSDSWWHRHFKWETLTVAGRTVEKGFVLTPTMCLSIVLAVAAMMGGAYWKLNDRIEAKDAAYQQQRDILVEIRTELRLTKEHNAEERERLERQIGDLAAWQQVTNKDLARLLPARNKQPQN